MLVFTRKSSESVVLGGPCDFERMLKITVLEISPGRVKLGFDVCEDVPVHRWEVWKRICAGGLPDSPTAGPAALEA
jgi:carbon storage regulator CsrA